MMNIQKATGLSILSNLNKAKEKLGKNLTKLATAKRINSAADDAAGLAVAKELEKRVRGFRQSSNALSDGLSVLNIRDGASQSITDMMQRGRELAIQASNGTLNDEQRSIINTEMQHIKAEIDRVANSTQYNGQSLTNGDSALSDGSGSVQAGAEGNPGDAINFNSSDLNISEIGIQNVDVSTSQGARDAIASFDSAIQQVNENRTESGAVYNRMEHAQNNVRNQEVNTASALSLQEDLNFAEGVSQKARDEILSQTATSVMSNFNQIARNNLTALLA